MWKESMSKSLTNESGEKNIKKIKSSRANMG